MSDISHGSFRIERTERRTAYENMMDALSEENSTFQVDLPIRRTGVRTSSRVCIWSACIYALLCRNTSVCASVRVHFFAYIHMCSVCVCVCVCVCALVPKHEPDNCVNLCLSSCFMHTFFILCMCACISGPVYMMNMCAHGQALTCSFTALHAGTGVNTCMHGHVNAHMMCVNMQAVYMYITRCMFSFNIGRRARVLIHALNFGRDARHAHNSKRRRTTRPMCVLYYPPPDPYGH